MKRAFLLLILTAAAALVLSGCGSMFEREYVVVSDYAPAPAGSARSINRITVASFEELRQTLLNMVGEGKSSGSIVFDSAYEGDLAEDMASVCWQVRTQDALCAYRVANIAYELSKLFTFSEVNVTISYSDAALDTGEITRMQFSTGIDDFLRQAMSEGKTRVAVLISQSFYSQEDMENEAEEVYFASPSLAPQVPAVSVNMFSGTGAQRLYEIDLDYGVPVEELLAFRQQLQELRPFPDPKTAELEDWQRALTACEYLKENCRYAGENGKNGIAAALLEGEADSEGIALAYVELCGRLGLECQVITGQRDWQDYCWNLVRIGEAYYHVDVPACAEKGLESGFLLTDVAAWNEYRWNVAAYPRCEGSLRIAALLGGPDAGEESSADGEENAAGEEISS